MKPLLALTMGDLNGVGPELLAKVLAMEEQRARVRLLVLGSMAAYEESRRFAPGSPDLYFVSGPAVVDWNRQEQVPLMDGGIDIPGRRPGRLDAEAGRCAVEWVKVAVRLAREGLVDAIVTAPLNKEAMHLAGFRYAGHTELIAELTGVSDVRMGLFGGALRVVHNSTHCSLREAIELAKTARILTTLRIADSALRRLGLGQRRIGVCGLNPHAGEAGAFGREEIDEITPALELARQEGLDCAGPYPADTIYNRMQAGHFDLVVAMYHDQGHAPMKLVAMDDTVNVTLGIPIIRTSADHGTAFDIAGTGQARPNSLKAAIDLAAQLAGVERP